MRKHFKRNSTSIVRDYGHVKLSDACVKANQTGFFALNDRVKPDSFDGNDTNINPENCFFGGRKLDVVKAVRDASEVANRSQVSSLGDDGKPSTVGSETNEG